MNSANSFNENNCLSVAKVVKGLFTIGLKGRNYDKHYSAHTVGGLT